MPSGARYELIPNGDVDSNGQNSMNKTHESDLNQDFTAYGCRKLKAGSTVALLAVTTAALACGLLCLAIFQQAQDFSRAESSWLGKFFQ